MGVPDFEGDTLVVTHSTPETFFPTRLYRCAQCGRLLILGSTYPPYYGVFGTPLGKQRTGPFYCGDCARSFHKE